MCKSYKNKKHFIYVIMDTQATHTYARYVVRQYNNKNYNDRHNIQFLFSFSYRNSEKQQEWIEYKTGYGPLIIIFDSRAHTSSSIHIASQLIYSLFTSNLLDKKEKNRDTRTHSLLIQACTLKTHTKHIQTHTSTHSKAIEPFED